MHTKTHEENSTTGWNKYMYFLFKGPCKGQNTYITSYHEPWQGQGSQSMTASTLVLQAAVFQ